MTLTCETKAEQLALGKAKAAFKHLGCGQMYDAVQEKVVFIGLVHHEPSGAISQRGVHFKDRADLCKFFGGRIVPTPRFLPGRTASERA